MNENKEINELIEEMRSLPEPDYDKKFDKKVQDRIHQNLLAFSREYERKRRKGIIMKRIVAGLASVAAILLFAVLIVPLNEGNELSSEKDTQPREEQPTTGEGVNQDPDDIVKTDPDKHPTDDIMYENTEYGFSFSLPDSWDGYQIISDTWEGVAINQQSDDSTEVGPILSIRHPKWTEENQRQDIPIMIFTHSQWTSMENGEFHIGAAPMGPKELERNNKYVFAIPARYNYAFPEGYEEVEEILENNPLQPKDVN